MWMGVWCYMILVLITVILHVYVSNYKLDINTRIVNYSCQSLCVCVCTCVCVSEFLCFCTITQKVIDL